MVISKRLEFIANKVKFRTLADIGTDHGYIPIYLAKENRIDRAVACDINTGPLQRAKDNIEKQGLQDIIDTRLCSGLKHVKPREVESCIIAGMGGMLIVDILKTSIICAQTFKQIILQPQQDLKIIRKFLNAFQFKITEEDIVYDNNKYYNIITCKYGMDINFRYTESEMMLGKIENYSNKNILQDYITYELDKKNTIREELIKSKKNSLNVSNRLSELDKEIKIYGEIKSCL